MKWWPVTTAKVKLPPKLVPVFAPPRGDLRYRGAKGGRGSGKSFSFAKMAAIYGYAEALRILCTRELQVSIKESFYAELKNAIASEPWLAAAYDVGENYIRGHNGTEFIFKGLRHNMTAVKSMAQVDICIVEEAEDIPEVSWQQLTPTIRAPKSEIWVIWNPCLDGSPVDNRFVKHTPERSKIVELNYSDNPWLSDELEQERRNDEEMLDENTYAWIWDGEYLTNSDSQVLAGKVQRMEFEPDDSFDGPYHGLDFGFANDPTAGVQCYIKDSCLYIRREAVKVKLELDDTYNYVNQCIPGIGEYVVRADCARPESISHLTRHGMPRIMGAPKWAGSVEDGIAHLRQYKKIYVHPECPTTLREARLYSYKVDKLTGDVLPQIVDSHNHCWDAVRYALAPIIKRRRKAGIMKASR